NAPHEAALIESHEVALDPYRHRKPGDRDFEIALNKKDLLPTFVGFRVSVDIPIENAEYLLRQVFPQLLLLLLKKLVPELLLVLRVSFRSGLQGLSLRLPLLQRLVVCRQ